MWQFWCWCAITSVRPSRPEWGFRVTQSKRICTTARLPKGISGFLGAENRYVLPAGAQLTSRLLGSWNDLAVATATFLLAICDRTCTPAYKYVLFYPKYRFLLPAHYLFFKAQNNDYRIMHSKKMLSNSKNNISIEYPEHLPVFIIQKIWCGRKYLIMISFYVNIIFIAWMASCPWHRPA